MSVLDINPEKAARECEGTDVASLDADLYNYATSEEVYILEREPDTTSKHNSREYVVKLLQENRDDALSRNRDRLDRANIAYPDTVSAALGSEFGHGYVVVQEKQSQTYHNLMRNDDNYIEADDFVDQVFEHIVEPAAEKGFAVDAKPHNFYLDSENELGLFDVQDGRSTFKDDRPRNTMAFELLMGLQDMEERYGNFDGQRNRVKELV